MRSRAQPGDLLGALPTNAPEQAESMERILQDFRRLIPPGITHWQHPSFFAFFPANSSPPSVLAEMLTAGIAAQCMLWETSPAANELEARMMQWLQELLGLPNSWRGVIQDSASGATLCAMLAAREKSTRAVRSRQAGLLYLRGSQFIGPQRRPDCRVSAGLHSQHRNRFTATNDSRCPGPGNRGRPASGQNAGMRGRHDGNHGYGRRGSAGGNRRYLPPRGRLSAR